MGKNLLIVHGGGPTAVINASLYGVIMVAKKSGKIDKVYGVLGGTRGILEKRFVNLLDYGQDQLERLKQTPASALGSSRFPLYEKDYDEMIGVLKEFEIPYVLLNGGNGTMDTCGKLYKACIPYGILVVGIPKTIDNDIACIDHSPGYGSAARYLAETVKEIGEDVRSLPIHVCIIEAMGRNAGWIAAASALARKQEGDAPHLIYLPERPFREWEFLEDVKRLYEEKGGVVVVVSEGLTDEKGESIVPPIYKTDRAVYYGDVSAHLAQLVIKKLGIKARSEKPGLAGRSSVGLQSPVDRQEAEQMGREAVKALLAGKSGVMPGLEREEGKEYKTRLKMIPVKEVMLHERLMPDSFIAERGNDVTEEFITWCRPLIGKEPCEFFTLEERMSNKE